MFSKALIDQMLHAGWLVEQPRVNEWVGGFAWTSDGEGRRLLLKNVIESFELTEEPEAPWQFTRECRQFAAASERACGHAAQSFWLACLDELKVQEDPHTVEDLVEILMADNDFLPAN